MLVIDIDDQQPSPRAKDETERPPAPFQFAADARKALEQTYGTPHATSGVRRQAVRHDQAVEVLNGDRAHADLGHRLQLIQGDRVARIRRLNTGPCAVPGAWNSVEECDDVAGVWIAFVDRDREQRSRERPLLHVRSLRQPRQTRGMLRIKRHV
jgi:hypothetical protein